MPSAKGNWKRRNKNTIFTTIDIKRCKFNGKPDEVRLQNGMDDAKVKKLTAESFR